jgi:hypothetical protein
MTTFNPDLWAETMWRSLKTYIDGLIDPAIYDVVLGYPAADELSRLMPLPKTLIHFDIEEIRESPLGMGDNYVNYLRDDTPPPPITGQTIEYWEAHQHVVDFDIGIWASAESGGVTSRLEARTVLSRLFSGKHAYVACMSITDGVHIKQFSGGRDLNDTIDDVPLWRMVDVTLTVLVFSRFKIQPAVPYIADLDDVIQEPLVEIGGVTIT